MVQSADSKVSCGLSEQRLQGAIGGVCHPGIECRSHYFAVELAHQFVEYIWIEHTQAIITLDSGELKGMPDTYPYGW